MNATAQGWRAMAREGRDAAWRCLRNGCYRSAISRAYYAMFSAVTAALIDAGVEPRRIQGTWSHRDLPDVARHGLPGVVGHGRSKDVKSRLATTYKQRVVADYMPGWSVDEIAARRCLTDATAVIRALELDK